MIKCGRDLTKQNEGCVLVAKPDNKGKWEIGWGHDIPAPLPGALAPEWTQSHADIQFEMDYSLAVKRAHDDVGDDVGDDVYTALAEPRQAVLNDIAYEIGGAGLAAFRQMLAAVRGGLWDEAAHQIQASQLFGQVPLRETRNIEIMRLGRYPAV